MNEASTREIVREEDEKHASVAVTPRARGAPVAVLLGIAYSQKRDFCFGVTALLLFATWPHPFPSPPTVHKASNSFTSSPTVGVFWGVLGEASEWA